MHRKKTVKITVFQLKKGLFRLKMKAVMLNSLLIIEEPWRGETSLPKLPTKKRPMRIWHLKPDNIIVMDYFGTLSY